MTSLPQTLLRVLFFKRAKLVPLVQHTSSWIFQQPVCKLRPLQELN